METAVDERDDYLAADLRFHTLILEAGHNELLAHLGGTLRGSLSRELRPDAADRTRDDRAARGSRRRDSRTRSACSGSRDARADRPHCGKPGRRRADAALGGVLEQDLRDEALAVVHLGERVFEAVGGKAVRHDRIEVDEALLEERDDPAPL